MAFEKILTGTWFLTDGIIDPLPIASPAPVAEALLSADIIADPLRGTNVLSCEWIYSRSWAYSTRFDTPREGDEKVFLRFDRLWGKAEVLVNGKSAGVCEGGASCEITRLLEPESNALSLRFEPMARRIPGDVLPPLGMEGNVCLVTGNGLSVIDVNCSLDKCGVIVDVRLDVTAAGRYVFEYTGFSQEEAAEVWRFEENLTEGQRGVTHRLVPAAGGLPRPREVRLNIIKTGIGCAIRRFSVPEVPASECKRIFRYDGVFTSDIAEKMRFCGADGVALAGQPSGSFFGLPAVVDAQAFSSPACVFGLPDSETASWPPKGFVFRLRGGRYPDEQAVTALHGGALPEKGADCAALTRYHQAQAIMDEALDLRRRGRRACFIWREKAAFLSAEGVLEPDGRERMAFFAQGRIWAADAVCAAPGADGCADIVAMSDRTTGTPASLAVTAFDLKGTVLAEKRMEFFLVDVHTPLSMELPRTAEGIVILRCVVTGPDGEALCRCDRVFAGENADLLALRGKVTRSGGKAEAGDGAVLLAPGVCLLPGETGNSAQEWVNEQRV